ncbi:metalloregulator ArsR/SmtB family transcription factor [Fulvimarina sp. MAC3]|uniref:ArsR/SmtB family transcription factor n=1 Tax=Fulvimarina sp. MAC3 TaxID=3148887 RepID=UPI0031FCEF85
METARTVEQLAALAHTDRLSAFRLLVGEGPEGMASGAIAEALDIAPTRMSFHLATLDRAGLLQSRRDGRHIRYAANFEAMRGLLAFLTKDCCGGRPEICGYGGEPFEAASSCDTRKATAR